MLITTRSPLARIAALINNDCDYSASFPLFIGDGCTDAEEGALGLSSSAPFDFFSVPIPSLNGGVPLSAYRDSDVTAQDAQSVFSFASSGTADSGGANYEADDNANGVRDGWEYDRTPTMTPPGPPDGSVTAADAQKAFAQATAAFACTTGNDLSN